MCRYINSVHAIFSYNSQQIFEKFGFLKSKENFSGLNFLKIHKNPESGKILDFLCSLMSNYAMPAPRRNRKTSKKQSMYVFVCLKVFSKNIREAGSDKDQIPRSRAAWRISAFTNTFYIFQIF